MACQELLLTLERMRVLSVVLHLCTMAIAIAATEILRTIARVPVDRGLLQCNLSDFAEPTLHPVRSIPLESLYNSLIDRHHYLGYRSRIRRDRYSSQIHRVSRGLAGGLPWLGFRRLAGATERPFHRFGHGNETEQSVIEGAYRHLIKERLDCTGACCRMKSAEAIIGVRSLRFSGDFNACWRFHREQELQRNHSCHYAAVS